MVEEQVAKRHVRTCRMGINGEAASYKYEGESDG